MKCQKSKIFEHFRNLRFQKKAQTFVQSVLKYIPKIIFVTIVTVVVIFLVALFNQKNVSAEDLRAEIFAQRIKSSLAYYDEEIDRVYPGVMDLVKFNDNDKENNKALAQTIYTSADVDFISAKLVLKDLDDNSQHTTYYKKKTFDKWVPFSFDKSKFLKLNKQRLVLIKKQNGFSPGRLQIEIITPAD